MKKRLLLILKILYHIVGFYATILLKRNCKLNRITANVTLNGFNANSAEMIKRYKRSVWFG